MSYKMFNIHTAAPKKSLLIFMALALASLSNNSFAAMINYHASLFGPGMNVHYCIDLDSSGSILADYDESAGTVSNISGELSFVTITQGFIKKGYNNIKNYVLGSFNDNEYVPEFLRDKNIFVDLSRGAEYEETKVTDKKIREWGWALYYDPDDYSQYTDSTSLSEALFANRDNLKTLRNPYKTFAQLCPKYAGGNSAGYHGWCGAGVEFFGDYGTPAPVPLPAAFYMLSAGLIGLISFSKKRKIV